MLDVITRTSPRGIREKKPKALTVKRLRFEVRRLREALLTVCKPAGVRKPAVPPVAAGHSS